jgi:hypothetical protein
MDNLERLPEGQLTSALNHLEAAIVLLDSAEAPAQIAAHVDLALHQLRAAITASVQPQVWPTN